MDTTSKLAVALDDYDRTYALRSGKVTIEDARLDVVCLDPQVTAADLSPFDLAEIPITAYLANRAEHNDEWIGIPVFLSRMFCHSFLYTSTDTRISNPGHLRGKKIGVRSLDAPEVLWILALLREEYGITAGQLALSAYPDRSLTDKLVGGECDAVFTTQTPHLLLEDGLVKRLIPNFVEAEKEYYRRTKIFPVCSTVVLRKSVHDRDPGMALKLFKAFEEAKALTYQQLRSFAQITSSHPWQYHSFDQTVRLMGKDFWSYGIEGNRHVLEAAVQYAHEQGLVRQRISIEELFPIF